MALPAGRYGVTKNQLLKIKKLPMNTIKLIEELTEKFDLLGTAAFKNSTSVVTESSDLVESGAVYDALGFGNKNLFDPNSNKNEWVTSNNQISTSRAEVKSVRVNCSEGDTLALSNDNIASSTNILLIAYLDSQDNVLSRTVKGSADKFVTATAPSDTACAICSFYTWAEVSKAQLEVGSTATAYEPYHASVEESLAEKCDNTVIAPVENGSTASQAYAVGEHFIRDGQFKEVTQPIASGGAINDSNTVDKPIADLLTVEKINGATSLLSGVTVDSGRNNVYRYGKLVFLDVKITVDSDLTIVGATSLLQLPINALAITTLTCFNASAPFAYENEFALYTNPLSASNILYINSTILKAGSYIISGFFFEK